MKFRLRTMDRIKRKPKRKPPIEIPQIRVCWDCSKEFLMEFPKQIHCYECRDKAWQQVWSV